MENEMGDLIPKEVKKCRKVTFLPFVYRNFLFITIHTECKNPLQLQTDSLRAKLHTGESLLSLALSDDFLKLYIVHSSTNALFIKLGNV